MVLATGTLILTSDSFSIWFMYAPVNLPGRFRIVSIEVEVQSKSTASPDKTPEGLQYL